MPNVIDKINQMEKDSKRFLTSTEWRFGVVELASSIIDDLELQLPHKKKAH